MKDNNGREYARLSLLSADDTVEVDAGFACLDAGLHKIMEVAGELCIRCSHGLHFLTAQLETDKDSLIGIYPTAPQHHENVI